MGFQEERERERESFGGIESANQRCFTERGFIN